LRSRLATGLPLSQRRRCATAMRAQCYDTGRVAHVPGKLFLNPCWQAQASLGTEHPFFGVVHRSASSDFRENLVLGNTKCGKVHRGKGGTSSRRRLPVPLRRSLRIIKGSDMVLIRLEVGRYIAASPKRQTRREARTQSRGSLSCRRQPGRRKEFHIVLISAWLR
jgi:hypothetical protein